MTDADDRAHARALFASLGRILKARGGERFLPGVDAALRALDGAEWRPDVRSLVRTMLAGAGTLGDFHIQSGLAESRAAANAELHRITADLWDRFSEAAADA